MATKIDQRIEKRMIDEVVELILVVVELILVVDRDLDLGNIDLLEDQIAETEEEIVAVVATKD